MSTELELLLEESIESEALCNRSRQIYNELENILMKKDYLQNIDCLVSQSGELRVHDTTPSSSNQNFFKINSTNKIKPNCPVNYNTMKKCQHSTVLENKNCFIVLQNKIHQFESYKNSMTQERNKYASEFLNLLETQNKKLSRESFENKNDSF